MRKTLLAVLAIGMFAVSANAQLLYKVSGNGIEKPSYVVASHRLINPQGVVQGIAGIEEAMTRTDRMCFETTPDSASFIRETRMLEGGKTLKTVLTPEQYKQLDTFLKKYEGVGMASPQVQKRYGSLTPEALREELEKLIFVANHMGEYDPTHTFDQYFEAQAKVNKLPVYGLTDTACRVECLRKRPMEEQVKALMTLIEHDDAVLGQMDKVLAAYGKKDMEAVAEAWSGCANVQKMIGRWVVRMVEIMQKPTLFIVDATRIGGSAGLLLQLRNAGYTVEGVQ